MPVVRFAGCRSDSLLGYLKALGVLRLLGTQIDPACVGAWDEATFSISTSLSKEAIEEFFVASYSPTPVLNLWNNGAGFDGKNDSAANTLRRITEAKGTRWEPYRRSLAFINDRYISSGMIGQYLDNNDKIDAKKKPELVRDLRRHCTEEMLVWLDASVLLTANELAFPYLLGSGGNDGHLDFSVNFAARALDICGDQPLLEAAQLLDDSLNDTAQGRLIQDVAIGQFSSRYAGGANAGNGFTAVSLVNPWDYVLMIEGAVLFSGSIGRRTDLIPGRPVFPFALQGVAAGYGSASAEEAKSWKTYRGEIWLPIWDGCASLRSVIDLLRKGRIDLPNEGERSVTRSAVLASDAATAVVTLGAPLGVRKFERIAFVRRNGLAFSAAALGAITVDERYDRGIAVISRNVASWIERIRRSQQGAGARQALRSFDDLLFAFSNVASERKTRARQELLVAVADLDRAIAHTRSELPRAPRIVADLVELLDDGTTAHRTAVAIASLGAFSSTTDTREQLRSASDDPPRTLRDLLKERLREDSKEPGAGWLRAACTISVEDATEFLAFERRERLRFSRLVRAYALIRLHGAQIKLRPTAEDTAIPAAYAVLKMVFDNPKARDARILRLLFTTNIASALALAVRRARTIRDLPFAPRDVSSVQISDAAWSACALALPLDRSVWNYRGLLNAALISRIPRDQSESVRTYLKSIE